MTDAIEVTLQDELFAIEEGFWTEGKQHFLDHIDAQCLLAFPQTGEMHGVKSREEVAATATASNRWSDLKMGSRDIVQPSPDVAIISYRADVTRADGEPYTALVSSAYAKRAEGWKLVFHQHSPVETGA